MILYLLLIGISFLFTGWCCYLIIPLLTIIYLTKIKLEV